MRQPIPSLFCLGLLALPAVAQAKICSDGKTYRASQQCPTKSGSKNRPTFRPIFLPTDKSDPGKYRADLKDFRAQAVDDKAAGKLTPAQFAHKIAQYDHAMAALNGH